MIVVVLSLLARLAVPIEHGYAIYGDCGQLKYAAGCDTGVRVWSPTDGEPLFIPPGAVAAWGEPAPIDDEETF